MRSKILGGNSVFDSVHVINTTLPLILDECIHTITDIHLLELLLYLTYE